MGWFSKQTTCDWCGVRFAGAGVVWEGMQFCGADCRDAQAAPAAPLDEPTSPRRARPEATLESVTADIRLAKEQLTRYREAVIDVGASVSMRGVERAVVGSDVAYLEAWQHLAEAARTLAALGADTGPFERLREFGFDAVSRGDGARLDLPTGQRLFRATCAELMSLADGVAAASGRAPVYRVTPDATVMAELLSMCRAEERRRAAQPDLFKLLEE